MSPTFGSLFAGIGGIDLGLERAGWECRWQVEWDQWAQRVLAAHWPDVPRHGDIAAVDWSAVEPVDLVAGGFPCQPFSIAGRQLAQADDRWLWPEFERCLRSLRPRYVLVENVPGLLGAHGGFGDVLGDLAALGYDAEWDCVPASAVGAPHERDRVWIVAYPSGERWQGYQSEQRLPVSTPSALAKHRDSFTGARSALGGDYSGLRDGDGLSVVMERRRLHGLGNAVVPQVVEPIGRNILAGLRDERVAA